MLSIPLFRQLALPTKAGIKGAGETATLTFTLTESATDFTAEDISVSGGSISDFTGSGTSYTATFTPTPGSTSNGVISVGTSTFSDAAGNQNSAASTVTLPVDTVIPTISIASNKTALKAGETATLTFTLTESATDFTAEDIGVSGGSISDFTDPDKLYSNIYTTPSGSTSNGVISVGTSTFSDAAGNQNSAASNTVTLAVDTVIPTIRITSDVVSLKAGETATLTFTILNPLLTLLLKILALVAEVFLTSLIRDKLYSNIYTNTRQHQQWSDQRWHIYIQ